MGGTTVSAGIVATALPVLTVVGVVLTVVSTAIQFSMARRPPDQLRLRRWALFNYALAGLFTAIAALDLAERAWVNAGFAAVAAFLFVWATHLGRRRSQID